LNNVKIH